ncbi:MAG: CapA family protein, partial [Bacteroidota bacterium]
DRHGISHAGAGANLAAARRPAVLDVNGLRLAFLAYSLTYPTEFYAGAARAGTAPGYEQYLRADIPAAKNQADLVIVSFHWSAELLNYPKDYQRRLGRLAIDLGASLVVGHHPHVLQGVEVYRGGVIAYSLGNFAFGSYSTKCRDSAILLVDMDRRGPATVFLYPVNVNNYEVAFQTRLRKGADAVRVLEDLRRFSAAFGTKIEADGDRGVIAIRPPEQP